MNDAISIVMPTQALRQRAANLLRAVESVLSQQGVRAIPIVVVNGPMRDAELTRELARRPNLRLTVLQDADLPAALKVGREQVDTPWFGVLDDDDELLPNALATRVEGLRDRPEYDVIVTNGLLRGREGDELNVADFSKCAIDPLRALMDRNWLVPCSGLFRTSAVDVPIFDGIPQYLEWTYLAIRISTSCKITFLNRPTFVYYTDTQLSRSKSRDSVLGGPAAIERLLELELPPDVRARLEMRVGMARHCAADLH
jgi:glycosyltransferase involved in cell wall biosynthesis